MRLRVLILLVLLVISAPARAAIEFLGLGPQSEGVVAGCDWSSDLGLPWVAVRPIGDFANGVTIEADTARSFTIGAVATRTVVTVAPAGPASSAAPVLVYEGRVTAHNGNDIYGKFGTSRLLACVRFTPPGESQTVHYAVRWRLSGSSTGAPSLSYLVWSPLEQIASLAGPDSGTFVGTMPGTWGSFCNFQFALNAGGPATGQASSIDRTLRVELYLDSQPLLDVGPGAAAGIEFTAPWPNPSSGTATFAYTLSEAADVQLVLADVSGRVVRTLEHGARAAGRATLAWDGRDQRGEPLPAGVYFAKLIVQRDGQRVVRERTVVRVR